MLAVDAHDLAFGTSRWSSKLVHGGLRYLANGQVGVAHESAVERGILMEVTAPHLTHAMPMLIPLDVRRHRCQAAVARGALSRATCSGAAPAPAGTRCRARAGSRPPRRSRWPRRCVATGCAAACCRWDGQLEDDARLVTAVARTAAGHGAHVRTRARVVTATGTGVELRDELTGGTATVSARAVVNATGVWAGDLVDEVALRPSPRHPPRAPRRDPPGLRVAVTAPVPGHTNRFVMVLPQPDGTLYVGLTDEPVEGGIPDVPQPTEAEIGFLLDVVSAAFAHDLRRSDVVGAYAGLRPLLDTSRTEGVEGTGPPTCPASTRSSPPAPAW